MKTIPLVTPKQWKALEYHPLSELVEFGVGIDLTQVAEHMKANGYDDSEPVVMLDGKILDGRHRHAAAIKAGVVPKFCEFMGDDPHSFVIKKLLRQHLDESQRAMLAAKLVNMQHGGDRGNQHAGGKVQTCTSVDDAAKMLNVSPRSIKTASKVIEEGTPQVQAAVVAGRVSVSDAEKIVDEKPAVQNRAVKTVERGHAPTAAKAVKMCSRCQRIGQVKDCEQCKEMGGHVRQARKEPEPEAESPKAGENLFDACDRIKCARIRALLVTSRKFIPKLEQTLREQIDEVLK